MIIVVKRGEDSNGSGIEKLYIDGKLVASVYPLCEYPEDATIERDLISCHEIVEFMQIAYRAGKSGDGFEESEESLEDKNTRGHMKRKQCVWIVDFESHITNDWKFVFHPPHYTEAEAIRNRIGLEADHPQLKFRIRPYYSEGE